MVPANHNLLAQIFTTQINPTLSTRTRAFLLAQSSSLAPFSALPGSSSRPFKTHSLLQHLFSEAELKSPLSFFFFKTFVTLELAK